MSLLDPLSHALAAVIAAAYAGHHRPRRRPGVRVHLGALHRRRGRRRPRGDAAPRHPRRPTGSRRRARPAAAAGARPALPQPPGRRQPACLQPGATPHRGRARHVARWGACRCWCRSPSGWRSTTSSPTSRPGTPVGADRRRTGGVVGRRRPCWASRWPPTATSAADRRTWWSWPGWPAPRPLLSYVTQRFLVAPNTVLTDVPEAMARVQQLMPAVSAVGLLVAGGVVPVALLVYWVCNSTWTLGQSAIVWRWFPHAGLARRRIVGDAAGRHAACRRRAIGR